MQYMLWYVAVFHCTKRWRDTDDWLQPSLVVMVFLVGTPPSIEGALSRVVKGNTGQTRFSMCHPETWASTSHSLLQVTIVTAYRKRHTNLKSQWNQRHLHHHHLRHHHLRHHHPVHCCQVCSRDRFSVAINNRLFEFLRIYSLGRLIE